MVFPNCTRNHAIMYKNKVIFRLIKSNFVLIFPYTFKNKAKSVLNNFETGLRDRVPKYCQKKKSPAHSAIQIAEIPIDLLHMTSKRSILRTTSNFRRSTGQKMNENYIVYKHFPLHHANKSKRSIGCHPLMIIKK